MGIKIQNFSILQPFIPIFNRLSCLGSSSATFFLHFLQVQCSLIYPELIILEFSLPYEKT